jgi:large subunit ribosomal protein L25
MSTQEETIIKAEKRTLKGKQVSQLRRAGILPGVIYGHKIESQAIQMDRHTVSQQMSRITPTTLVTVDVDGNKNQSLCARSPARRAARRFDTP